MGDLEICEASTLSGRKKTCQWNGVLGHLSFCFGNLVWILCDYTIAVSSFISTVVSTTFGAGIVFELPIIIYFLARIGLVTPQFLKGARKISYIVILIVAAIITPPDVTSQVIVSIPLFILYEVGIWIAARVERKKAQSI